MEALILQEGKNTPKIVFDPENNTFSMTGRSFPENAKKFYTPVLEWLDAFQPAGSDSLRFQFELYYVSSSSIIALLEVMRRLDALNGNGTSVTVTWHYDEDDDDIKKIGEDYERITSLEFEIVPNP